MNDFSEPIDLMSTRMINETALREHALKCSETYRCGKFTRVGQDFIDEVKTDVEVWLRELRGKAPTLHSAIDPGEENLLSGALVERVAKELNRAIARLIQNKVQKQPSCGKTLGRTR